MAHRPYVLVTSCFFIACGAGSETADRTATATEPLQAEPAQEDTAAAREIAATCPDVGTQGGHTRAVAGAHRGCASDADCASVRLDCSNIRCTAVHADHAGDYAEPIGCDGYTGPVANYDCMPRFGSERPVCLQGCCISERSEGHATAREACDAIAQVYSEGACTIFGPSFSVDSCLDDVSDIRAEGAPEKLRSLQVGLDCARTVGTCDQIADCVALYHGSR